MKQVKLATNLSVAALSKTDAKVVYHEIFEMQAYEKHGIIVKDHDTIIDIGANIGLFSIRLAQRYKDLKLYLFEPVQQIFNCLSLNSKGHLNGSTYVLQHYGLSHKAADGIFEFSPYLSMTSGMYAKELSSSNSKDASLSEWLIALVQDLERAGLLSPAFSSIFQQALSGSISRFILMTLLVVPLSIFLIWLHLTKQKVSCTLKTFSEALRHQNIEAIDLVKIDVEGAEMDVLSGIEVNDWKKIRQLIIEVHDVNNRVKQIVCLLEEQGYKVNVDREDWSLHRLMRIYTVYASK